MYSWRKSWLPVSNQAKRLWHFRRLYDNLIIFTNHVNFWHLQQTNLTKARRPVLFKFGVRVDFPVREFPRCKQTLTVQISCFWQLNRWFVVFEHTPQHSIIFLFNNFNGNLVWFLCIFILSVWRVMLCMCKICGIFGLVGTLAIFPKPMIVAIFWQVENVHENLFYKRNINLATSIKIECSLFTFSVRVSDVLATRCKSSVIHTV